MAGRIRTHLKTGETLTASAQQAVQGLLGMLGFDPLAYAVFEVWDRETRGLAKSEAIAIQGRKICVRVASTIHRHELLYSKDRLIRKINEAMGRPVINDIQFELESDKGRTPSEQNRKPRWGRGY